MLYLKSEYNPQPAAIADQCCGHYTHIDIWGPLVAIPCILNATAINPTGAAGYQETGILA